jgi:hypothetical protein
MLELQTQFLLEILIKFLARAQAPLGAYRNSVPQNKNDGDFNARVASWITKST